MSYDDYPPGSTGADLAELRKRLDKAEAALRAELNADFPHLGGFIWRTVQVVTWVQIKFDNLRFFLKRSSRCVDGG